MKHTVKCPKCSGTGRVRDNRAIGEEMKVKRVATGKSLRDLGARMVPRRTAAYLSDLERGNRHWSDIMIGRYLKALQ